MNESWNHDCYYGKWSRCAAAREWCIQRYLTNAENLSAAISAGDEDPSPSLVMKSNQSEEEGDADGADKENGIEGRMTAGDITIFSQATADLPVRRSSKAPESSTPLATAIRSKHSPCNSRGPRGAE